MLKRFPKFVKNFYFLSSIVFIIWILFLDSNDLIGQAKLALQLKRLKSQKEYYLRKIEEVKKERQELFGSNESLEKFARERYFMKKKTEDIYLIEE